MYVRFEDVRLVIKIVICYARVVLVGKQFHFMLSSAVSHKSQAPVLRQEKDAEGNGPCDGPAMHLGEYFNKLR